MGGKLFNELLLVHLMNGTLMVDAAWKREIVKVEYRHRSAPAVWKLSSMSSTERRLDSS